MTDQSHLDAKYFIDTHIYNCPFCNRRNVRYRVKDIFYFDWSNSKTCFAYLIECSSCLKRSFHLSFDELDVNRLNEGGYGTYYGLELREGQELDNVFFYSVPTSFFVMDSRIPRVLRELVSEAEG